MKAIAARAAGLDLHTQSRLSTFSLARLSLMALILFTTIFLRQDNGAQDIQVNVLSDGTILRMYGVLAFSFFFSLVNVSLWEQTLRVRLYVPSQLFYDLLLTSYLVYLTGVNDSIFLFLYLLNIVFASAVYQLSGALIVAAMSGCVYAFIYGANVDLDNVSSVYNLLYSELLFLLTALLCGQLMDELKKQKTMLESQRQSIARLELINDRLLNSIPVGIVTVDKNEYVQNVNSAALSLLGLEHPPEMKLKYYELLPELRGVMQAWGGMSDRQRLRFVFKNGTSIRSMCSLNLVPMKQLADEPIEDISHILVFQDVSLTLELEKKLEFESRLAATGELAAGIAHEIRNPLASISGSIEVLSNNLRIESDQDKRLFDIALREINRLNNLITDFLEFAKPKDESPEAFSLKEMVREVADAVQSGKGKGGPVEIDVEIAPALLVHANRERIKQVFFNLFLNSREAAGERAVKILVKSSNGDDGLVKIDVTDNGPGIPQELSTKIFDPFFTTKSKGTGLGLATVARIIKAAKGEIQVLPSEGGAHFQMTIPAPSAMELTGTGS
ncbi:MAG TPA: ATP-binding protein [Bdellovibrionota bacterium]|jgi:two-component system sensor histidine kinase PilS (NtrC family)